MARGSIPRARLAFPPRGRRGERHAIPRGAEHEAKTMLSFAMDIGSDVSRILSHCEMAQEASAEARGLVDEASRHRLHAYAEVAVIVARWHAAGIKYAGKGSGKPFGLPASPLATLQNMLQERGAGAKLFSKDQARRFAIFGARLATDDEKVPASVREAAAAPCATHETVADALAEAGLGSQAKILALFEGVADPLEQLAARVHNLNAKDRAKYEHFLARFRNGEASA